MKATVKFIAQASVTREIEVEVPDAAGDEAIRKAAIEQLERSEDLYNFQGLWGVNRIDPDTIILDTSEPFKFKSKGDQYGALDTDSIIPESL